jgi:cytochrome b
MKKQLIYDMTTRSFHWLFAALFLSAFVIAKTVDEDSQVFSYHMMAGLLMGFVVLLRIFWGFIGTRYARFSSFEWSPKSLFAYFVGILSGERKFWSGHNPASSWSAFLMMFLALGSGATGYLMTTGVGEGFEDLHEVLANTFFVVVALHIAGVLIHGLRYRDGIFFAMLSGKKEGVLPNEAIRSAAWGKAVVFWVLVAAFATYVVQQYNADSRVLTLFGVSLQLGG